jgi:hypothetical protein
MRPSAMGGEEIIYSLEHAAALGDFRRRLYGRIGRRADALFEPTDAILTTGSVTSPPYLTASHRSTAVAGEACTPC